MDAFDKILAGAIRVDDGLFRLRDDYREAEPWTTAPFVLSVAGRIFEVDHIAITLPDPITTAPSWSSSRSTAPKSSKALAFGRTSSVMIRRSPAPISRIVFATAKLPGGLLVVAAPNKSGDQLDRFRNNQGGDAVHHVAIHADDINRIAGELVAEVFEVSAFTIWRWKMVYDGFREAIELTPERANKLIGRAGFRVRPGDR